MDQTDIELFKELMEYVEINIKTDLVDAELIRSLIYMQRYLGLVRFKLNLLKYTGIHAEARLRNQDDETLKKDILNIIKLKVKTVLPKYLKR
jgi:hypothetical protein